MEADKYRSEIERLLRDIPELERILLACLPERERISCERSLKMRTKRFEHMIPYRFRLELRTICQQAGVKGDFME
jgi:hypothetical protein